MYESYRIIAMQKPTEAELEVLAILWELKEASVRQVHERLAETKETGYTTTLKIMQIMHAKGMVSRDEKKAARTSIAQLSSRARLKSLY